MRTHRHNRSQFDSLSDVERIHVRQAAQTTAHQMFRAMPGQGEPHTPGNTGGSYNSRDAGSTVGSTMPNTGGGRELLARVAGQQVRRVGAPSGMVKTETSTPWVPSRRR